MAKEGLQLIPTELVETNAIMASLQITAGNDEIILLQLTDIMLKINSGKGTFGRLIQDSTIAERDEDMEVAKYNIFYRR